MAIRTTAELVRKTLNDDYGPRANAGGDLPDLLPPIRRANVLVNRIATLSAAGSGVTVLGNISTDADALLEIETLLAAHFYTSSDKPFASDSMGGASASFQGQTGQGLRSTRYGQDAIDLDYSRILSAIDMKAFASASSLTKTASERLDWEERIGNQ